MLNALELRQQIFEFLLTFQIGFSMEFMRDYHVLRKKVLVRLEENQKILLKSQSSFFQWAISLPACQIEYGKRTWKEVFILQSFNF